MHGAGYVLGAQYHVIDMQGIGHVSETLRDAKTPHVVCCAHFVE